MCATNVCAGVTCKVLRVPCATYLSLGGSCVFCAYCAFSVYVISVSVCYVCMACVLGVCIVRATRAM